MVGVTSLPLRDDRVQAALYYARKRRRRRQSEMPPPIGEPDVIVTGYWNDDGTWHDVVRWNDGEL